jgi:hypothetical protein
MTLNKMFIFLIVDLPSDNCFYPIEIEIYLLLFSLMTSLDSGVCDLMSACGEGVGNELFQMSGDDVECQFCTKVY